MEFEKVVEISKQIPWNWK